MKSFIIALILIFAFEASAREARQAGGRIVGGVEIGIDEIPFQISLRYDDSHICGGSIISSLYVLSAAHCTFYFPKTDLSIFSIRAGSSRIDQGGSIHNISSVVEHPRFDTSLLDYDATILKISNQIFFDKFRQPILLPFFGEETVLDSIVATSGWGLTLNDQESNLSLRNVELRISNRTQCHEAYIGDGGITSRMICAYAKGRDSCSGGKKIILNLFN